MYKILLYTFLITTLFSCEQKKISKPEFKFEKYLDSIKSIDKLWASNTALREDINKRIKKDLVNKIDNGLFDTYPLILDRINECNGKYYLEFDNYYHLNDYKNNPVSYHINKVRFDFIGKVSKDIAFKLQEKNIYLVKFKFDDYIDLNNMDKYCQYVLMSPYIGLKSSSYGKSEVEFGAIAIKIDSVNIYNETL